MSYDLLFATAPGSTFPPTLDYFTRRPHYRVDSNQAIYEHPDTGVYFIFELITEQSEDEPEAWLQLILNLYRPHYFGLEAAGEISAFAQGSGTLVYDLQDPDPGVRSFDSQVFLAGWNDANRKGYRALLERTENRAPMPSPDTLPTAVLDAVWRWNWTRTARNSELGEDVFIPRISFLRQGGQILTTAVWSDAIPVHLPQVDTVIVYRDHVRKRRWLKGVGQPDMALVTWHDLVTQLPAALVQTEPVPFLDLANLDPKPALLDYLRGLPAMPEKPTLVAAPMRFSIASSFHSCGLTSAWTSRGAAVGWCMFETTRPVWARSGDRAAAPQVMRGR